MLLIYFQFLLPSIIFSAVCHYEIIVNIPQNEVAEVEEAPGRVEVFQRTVSLVPACSPGTHWVAVSDPVKEHTHAAQRQDNK